MVCCIKKRKYFLRNTSNKRNIGNKRNKSNIVTGVTPVTMLLCYCTSAAKKKRPP